MSWTKLSARLLLVALVLFAAACHDAPAPTEPTDQALSAVAPAAQVHAPQELAEWFAKASPEVMALPQTVFADHDEAAKLLVFGVEADGAIRGVRQVLNRLDIPSSAYTIQVTEPIHFMSETLRTKHRPTVGGIQIHWSIYVCTLGFNVDHSGGRSFITNSHCTDKRGENSGTIYYQPTSSVDPNPIGVEADDPAFFRGGVCPRGKVCRYSDAARALYDTETESNRGEIAKTTGVNNGDLNVAGSFTVASQDNSTTEFAIGSTVNKVGRTTGWTSGDVDRTCVNVNVSGSNVHMLCETLVEANQQIVAGGDSGSPVFKTGSGDNVELVGILWGGNSSGTLFVFSPLKHIQDELGGLTATSDGTGGGTGGGNGGGDDENGDECIPRGPFGNNCN